MASEKTATIEIFPVVSQRTSKIGSRLREFREKKGWTQAELGEKTAIGQRKIAYYEGEAKNIPADLQQKLAAEGLNLQWLATGEGEMLRPSSFADPIERPAWAEPGNTRVAETPVLPYLRD
jgi:transcriptional regulator with XRE-family HTH domain